MRSPVHSFVLIFFTFILFNANVLSQSGVAQINKEATSAYESGDYEVAIIKWKQLYRSGNSDPDLFINIGNTHSMLGNVPDAIMFYEKAKRYRAADSELQRAIKNERNKIADAVVPIQPFFLIEWVHAFLSFLRPGIWAAIGLGFLLIAVIKWLMSLNAITVNGFYVRGRNAIYLISGILFIVISGLSYKQIYRLDEGIILSVCELKQGPSAQSPLIRVVNPGEKVMLKDHISGWYKVNLLNLDEGWLEGDCLSVINVRDRS